jgi:hypothetical protein
MYVKRESRDAQGEILNKVAANILLIAVKEIHRIKIKKTQRIAQIVLLKILINIESTQLGQ